MAHFRRSQVGLKSLLAFVVIVAASFVGCSSKKEVEPPIKEIPTIQGDLAEGSDVSLVENGKKLYQSGIYGIARDTFDSLARTYPESPYVEYAEIKAADADFELREYVSAAQRYEQIAASRPGSTNLPYVILRAGRSLQLSTKGPGRDEAPLRHAMELYTKLSKEYPDSAYAAIGEKHRLEALRQVAETEQSIIDYYAFRGNDKAVESRKAAYAAELEPEITKEVPEDPMHYPAPLLARAAPPKEEETIRTALARPQEAEAPVPDERSAPRRGIHHIECSTSGQKMAVLYLSEALPAGSNPETAAIEKEGTRAARVTIPGLEASARTESCFSSNDLQIATDGTVTVMNQEAPTAMAIGNPDRVILIFPG